MSNDFFKALKGFNQFAALTIPENYVPAPAGWYVVVTDIKGSTRAINEGRYKEVNMVGAAAIIAVLNACGDVAVPYAFGGDGATALIPAELVPVVRETLGTVQAKVQSVFALELRAGCIALSDLYSHNTTLAVGKFHLSETVAQAVFQGTALALAESWLKGGGGHVLPCTPSQRDDPNLEGLECRWEPIENRNGKILSLLVRVTPAYEPQARRIYAQILRDIETIFPEYAAAAPVHRGGLSISFSPARLSTEVKLRAGKSAWRRALYLLRILLINAIGYYSFKTGRKDLRFDGQRYLSELVANSDARKFDEMLRMVLDSTDAQHNALAALLDAHRSKGEIAYGIHVSPQALMTCLVFSFEAGDHVHFIDGSDGGYAMAAKQMKQQLAREAA